MDQQRNLSWMPPKQLSRCAVRKPRVQRDGGKRDVVILSFCAGGNLFEMDITIPRPVKVRIVNNKARAQRWAVVLARSANLPEPMDQGKHLHEPVPVQDLVQAAARGNC